MTAKLDYQNDVQIDVDALDIELALQSIRFWKYADWYAKCREQMDLAKEALDLCVAEMDQKIRSDPERYGITDRLTEPAIKNAIVLSEEYKLASKEYIRTKKDMEISKGAVESMRQKRDNLGDLVKLHGQNYFAGPSVPRDLSREWHSKQMEKDSDVKVSQAMKFKRIKK